MPKYFFDTNAIVKYYHIENGSEYINDLILNTSNIIFISNLSVVETISTFARKVRTNELAKSIFEKTQNKFFEDITANIFILKNLTHIHFQAALKLINIYATTYSLRTLDALQFAITKELQNNQSLDYFVSSDQKLINIIKEENIECINPEKFENKS